MIPRSLRALPPLTLFLVVALLTGCGEAPSPLQDAGPVDHVEIRHRHPGTSGTWTPTIVSRDSALIAGLLAIAAAPGAWQGSWHTVPAGEQEVGLFQGDALVGSLHFAPGFLLVKSPTTAGMHPIDSVTWQRLQQLVTWFPPRFEDYATRDTLFRTLAAVDYLADPDARRFRVILEAARKAPADFNGHYQFVVWGCGTQCTSHLILDLRTGRTHDDTLVNFSCGTITYRRESGLVVTGPDTTGATGAHCAALPVRYFAWAGTSLEELHPGPGTAVPLLPVSIVDSVIRIPLKNGGEVRLVGNPRAEMQTRYTYGGHLKSAPFHGVSVEYSELDEYLLFHDSTGRRITLDDKPVVSPTGSRLAVASFGLESDSRRNSLSIMRLAGDSLIPEFADGPTEWGPKEPVWAGEDTLRFLRVWAREERKAQPQTPALLVHVGPNWVIQGTVPDSLPEDSTEVH